MQTIKNEKICFPNNKYKPDQLGLIKSTATKFNRTDNTRCPSYESLRAEEKAGISFFPLFA